MNPFEKIQGVGEVFEVVSEYVVAFHERELGHGPLQVAFKVVRYLSRSCFGKYDVFPSHELLIDGQNYRGPGDGPHDSAEQAVQWVVSEYSSKVRHATDVKKIEAIWP